MQIRIITLLALMTLAISNSKAKTTNTFSKQNFDFDWRFFRGGAISAENYDFDDASWRKLDLPHDFSIEDLPNTKSPFDILAISQVNGGFTVGGTGWYRKDLVLSLSDKGKKIILTFDGIYMNSLVYLNGKPVGGNPYGYTEFSVDISENVFFDKKNVIAVKVQNEGENSRWYSGSGIYRHVWLSIKNPIHFAHWGTFITTKTTEQNNTSTIIKTKIQNETTADVTIKLVSLIVDKQGKTIAQNTKSESVKKGQNTDYEQIIEVKKPNLWSLDNPYLYSLVTQVFVNNKVTDSQIIPFGIRTLKFSSDGFFINGQNTKLKGGCLHHDNGPLGSKTYDRAEFRKVEMLKNAGFNAVRTSHNPPSNAFLDACDQLGMLVIDEIFDCWKDGKNPNDYNLYFDKQWKKDVEAMVLRDRNHPSIIMWSNGNEIPFRDTLEVVRISKMINEYIKTLDQSRPTTAGIHELGAKKDKLFGTLDISGYNYAAGGDHWKNDVYSDDHVRVPARLIYESEAYPLEAFDSWQKVLRHSFVFGAFVWTALDYIGGSVLGGDVEWPDTHSFPFTLAYCGDIDICGNRRPSSYYRDALWKTNQLSVFVSPSSPTFPLNSKREDWSKWHWHDVVADWNHTGHENKPLDVVVYSSCEQVELFLNDKLLGKKITNTSTKFLANWAVNYQAGTLKAIGYSGGKQVNTSVLKTSTAAQNINLSADRNQIKANSQDLSYVQVILTDKNGVLDPKAQNLIKFEIEGPGQIIGVGNGKPTSLESYQLPERKAWQGKCLVVIKSTKKSGTITLKASSDGLTTANISIESK